MSSSTLGTRRLRPGDTALAKRLFASMAAVFDEEPGELSDAYVDALLASPAFWAIAATDGEEVVGGLTAHTLPMTRTQAPEVFLYDIAVVSDRQRRGIGKRLVEHLRELAAAQGIGVVFVAADDEDAHALDFYRALGGDAAPVTMFTFGATPTRSG